MPQTLTTSSGDAYSINWPQWQPTDRATLTFIRRPGELLLILKKRGLGQGKFNAPGGRLELGETPEQAAARETREEIGLDPLGLICVGLLDFAFVDGYNLRCHVFTADRFRGVLTETDEARPFWCAETDIPYGQMWSDDRIWLPLLLEGRAFEARFVFDGEIMLWHELRLGPVGG